VSWVKLNATITANSIASPSGVVNADTFIDNSNNTSHVFYKDVLPSSTGVMTGSVYLKNNNRQFAVVTLCTGSGGSIRYSAVVDLQNGTITQNNSLNSPTSTSSSIESVGNGWYRVSVNLNCTTTASGSNFLVLATSNTGTPTTFVTGTLDPAYAGNSSSIYAWGAQLEAGSYPTSYIPTTSASVTRNADAISKTGISSLIGQTEGVLYLDLYASGKNNDANTFGTWLIAGDSAENFQIYNLGTTLYWYAKNTAGLIIDQSADQTIVEGTRYKIAFAYKSGDYALYINGVQKRTNANANVPIGVSQFNLSSGSFGASPAIVKNEYNVTALWKTRLTNAQLAQLTTI
jgi:hypothetical protein